MMNIKANRNTKVLLWAVCSVFSIQAYAQSSLLGSEAARKALLSAPAPKTVQDYVMAVVGVEPITYKNFQARMVEVAKTQPKLTAEQVRERSLDDLINEKVVIDAAKAHGAPISDIELDSAIENIAKQNKLSKAELKKKLAANGENWEAYQNALRSKMLVERYQSAEIANAVSVSPSEISDEIKSLKTAQTAGQKAAHTEHPASLTKINLGHILVKVPADASPDMLEKAAEKIKAAYAKLNSGVRFALVAKQYSEAQEAVKGGELGLYPVEEYPEFFRQVAQNIPMGGYSPIVRSPVGLHLLKVLERESIDLPPGSVDENAPVMVTATHARHILLLNSDKVTPENQTQQLAKIKREIESKKRTFEQTAQEISQDGSAANGGDLGWTGPGQFVPEFAKVMDALPLGKISDPLQSRFGVHLIQVLERRQETLSDEALQRAAEQTAREKKSQSAMQDWLADLRKKAYIEYRAAQP